MTGGTPELEASEEDPEPASSSRSDLTGPPRLGRTFASFSNPAYRLLWFSMLASFLGNQMHQVTRGFLALQLTGQASAIGWVMASWGVPMLFFSLLGGVVADRYDRRWVLILAQAGQGVMGLAIALLLLFDMLEMWHLIATGVWQGTMFAFNGPARQALLPEIVGEDGLMNAIALNNAAMNLTRILGPTIAGVLLATTGATAVYFVMASAYIAVLALLFALPKSSRDRSAEAHEGVFTEMKSGVRYVFVEHRLLAGLIVLAFVPVMIGFPYQMLLPVFQEQVFDVDPKGLGFMYTVSGVGALVGSLFVATYSDHPRKSAFQLVAGLGFGISVAMFAWSPNFWVAIAVLPVVGGCSMTFMALNNTLVMAATHPDYHGRVMSVYMLTWALMPLGGIPMSLMTDSVGAPATVGVAGLVITLFMLAAARFMLRVPAAGVVRSEPGGSRAAAG